MHVYMIKISFCKKNLIHVLLRVIYYVSPSLQGVVCRAICYQYVEIHSYRDMISAILDP